MYRDPDVAFPRAHTVMYLPPHLTGDSLAVHSAVRVRLFVYTVYPI